MKKLKIVLILTLTILFNACSSDSNNDENPNNSEYYYYVSGKINGQNFIYGQKTDDTTLKFQQIFSIPLEGATCAYSDDQGLDYKISYGTSIYPDFDNTDTQPTLGIDFIRFYRCSDSQSSSEVFNDLFTVGNYQYSNDDESSGIMKQVGITYSPIASGYEYYKTYGGSQSSSTFKITSSQEDNSIDQTQIVEGEFSAKLYNSDNASEFIEITEGKFKISISK